MPDNILRVGAEFDVSGIVAGSQQATVAMDQLGTKVGDLSAAMLDELYPTEKAVAEASEEVAASTGHMTNAMGAARVEMGALEGSTGMMAGGLARVAAQSQTLAPLIQAAFVPFALIAFADILVIGAEKLYSFYQNVVNARDELKAYGEVTKTVSEYTATLAKETESAYIALLKLEDPLEADRQKMRAITSEEFKFKINDKELNTLKTWRDDTFVPFVQSLQDFPASQIDEKMKLVAGSIDYLQKKLAAPRMTGILSRDELEAQLKLLQAISVAMDEFQSKANIQQRAAGAELGNDQAAAAKKTADEQEAAAKKRQAAEYAAFEALNSEQESAARGAEQELRQIEEVARKKEEAERKALDLYWQEFNTVQSVQEEITKGVEAEIKKREELKRQEAELDATIQARMDETGKKASEARIKAINKEGEEIAKPITRAMDSMVKGVIMGTQTVSQAFARMGVDIIISVVESLAKAGVQFAAHEVALTLAHLAGTQARVATTGAGAAESESILTAAHLKEMLIHAKGAAGGAFHAVMKTVPFPADVVLAPAAAGAAFVGVMAFAEKGAVVPKDMGIYAHAGEMILPKNLSEGLAKMISGGQGGGGTNISVNAMDAQSFKDFAHRNQRQFAAAFKSIIRNGARA